MPASTDRLHAVLQRFERPLLGYALVRCGGHGAAEDAVQETLLRFLQHDPQGEVEALAPWLFTTCRNVLTDLHRKSPVGKADSMADASGQVSSCHQDGGGFGEGFVDGL